MIVSCEDNFGKIAPLNAVRLLDIKAEIVFKLLIIAQSALFSFYIKIFCKMLLNLRVFGVN